VPRRLTSTAVLVVGLLGFVGWGTLPAASAAMPARAASKARPAGLKPSPQAKMVCAPEAQVEIAASLGAQSTQVTAPTWTDHVYSCQYMYPNGSFTLSVKELPNAAATTRYFNDLGTRLGRRPDRLALAQGAFLTTNGSLVVRKDYKVLDIDITGIPAQFGVPPQVPVDVSVSVAATILTCWKGG
jgi:hypothetical protein